MSKTVGFYGIYDNAVNQYGNLFTAPSEDHAKRSFIMSYAQDDSFTRLFGKDFRLDYLGDCDVESGDMTPVPPVTVMTMTDAVNYLRLYDDEVENAV